MRVAVPVTNRSSDRCYPRISFIPISKWKNPMIAFASEVAFLQKAFSEHFVSSESISSPSLLPNK